MAPRKIKYLDPKNDLTFRRIFGEHPHILKSFLNALLPLDEGQVIEEITYLEPEIIPELPSLKRSIVDVHCTDNQGRQFIVEMQMYWTSAFKQRMLFNAGKAYVRQLKGGSKYRELKPVYGLCLVDDTFLTTEEFKGKYYHHYRMVHVENTDEWIEGLELIFIELPKFRATSFTDKKISTLWLRFLTEIDENTEEVSNELLTVKEITEALECVSASAFTEEELLYYDQYWDAIRVEKAAIEALKEQNEELTEAKLAMELQLMEERRQKEEERRQKEEALQREAQAMQEKKQAMRKLAEKMLRYGEPLENIIRETGLSEEEIKQLQ